MMRKIVVIREISSDLDYNSPGDRGDEVRERSKTVGIASPKTLYKFKVSLQGSSGPSGRGLRWLTQSATGRYPLH